MDYIIYIYNIPIPLWVAILFGVSTFSAFYMWVKLTLFIKK
jgi:hypothetical protein